jgi:hypothetical protein
MVVWVVSRGEANGGLSVVAIGATEAVGLELAEQARARSEYQGGWVEEHESGGSTYWCQNDCDLVALVPMTVQGAVGQG